MLSDPVQLSPTDLNDLEAAVGSRAYVRGLAYAAGGRVLSLHWHEREDLLIGEVSGSGSVYSTHAFFGGGGFDYGDCSCPIGYNCKHVAALVVSADGLAGSIAGPELKVLPGGRDSAEWEWSLRGLTQAREAKVGDPLAIQLELRPTSNGPQLRAGLMRPGAQGGWVNRSLKWSSLEHWQGSISGLRSDHLALLRELVAISRAGATAGGYYARTYGYGSAERWLDLGSLESSQLWSILDQAERLGLPLIHATKGLGELPPYLRGEVKLDVRVVDEAGTIAPTLVLEDDAAEPVEPIRFIGDTGHGLVCSVAAKQGSQDPSPPTLASTNRVDGPLRLVRLQRETQPELQRMLLEGDSLTVPALDLDRFRIEACPALASVAPVFSSDGSFSPPEVSGPSLGLRARHGKNHSLDLTWEWLYRIDDQAQAVPLAPGIEPGFRDPDAERQVATAAAFDDSRLQRLGLLDEDGRPTTETISLEGVESMVATTELLPGLDDDTGGPGVAVTIEAEGDPPDYRDLGEEVEIGVSTADLAGTQDWFDLAVTIRVGDSEVPLADAFAALSAGESHMLLPDGAYFSLEDERLRKLRRLIEEARALSDGPENELRISPYQVGLWSELAELGVVSGQAEDWQRQADKLLSLDSLAEHELPEGIEAELRPYQLEGFRWLASIWELGLGGILADDMGLGKTLQTLALVVHAGSMRSETAGETEGAAPFLVVAPTSVVPNWSREAERFAPGLRVETISETFAKSGRDPAELAGADIVVTTYTLLRMDSDRFNSIQWSGLILDEAQYVKNHQSKTHVCVRKLPAPFKLAITGTPLENNLMELWSLLSVTSPGLFPDPKGFAEHYARPIERERDGEKLTRLRRRIKPLVKRRRKEVVAADLPAKQEQVLEVDLHPKHRKLYDTRLQRERQKILGLIDDFDRNRFTILRSITLMRQLSLHAGLTDPDHEEVPCAKLRALGEQLEEVAGGGHRALVFSQFTGFLAKMRAQLERDGIGYCYLDGSTRNRDRVIEQFREGTNPVFLISLKAGGFGLNLTEADYCFLMDPWWNPAAETQAIDRTHRIGQTKNVMVYRLVSGGTIEEKVVALARRKAELFAGVMDEGDEFAGSITAEDIRGLIT